MEAIEMRELSRTLNPDYYEMKNMLFILVRPDSCFQPGKWGEPEG